jgi:hypothetical protein
MGIEVEKEHEIFIDNGIYNGISVIACREEECRFNKYHRFGIIPAKTDGIVINLIALHERYRRPEQAVIKQCVSPKPPCIRRIDTNTGICSQYTPNEKGK